MHCTHAYTVTCGSSLVCVRVISIHGRRHAHLFLSVVFFLVSLYLVLKSFFHLFLIPAVVPDENSMEDPLCNSSFGSMVSLDYVTPDTQVVVMVSIPSKLHKDLLINFGFWSIVLVFVLFFKKTNCIQQKQKMFVFFNKREVCGQGLVFYF